MDIDEEGSEEDDEDDSEEIRRRHLTFLRHRHHSLTLACLLPRSFPLSSNPIAPLPVITGLDSLASPNGNQLQLARLL